MSYFRFNRRATSRRSVAAFCLASILACVVQSAPARADCPTLLGSYNTAGSVGICTVGHTAYVATLLGGLNIVDVTDPAAPVLLGNFHDGPTFAQAVAVVGDVAYVANGDNVQIVDVSQPSAPALLGQFDTFGEDARALCVVGSTAYVAEFYGSLLIIDVSNPSTPTLLGSSYLGFGEGVTVVGDIAYVANAGLLMLDVSNPAAPAFLGFYDTYPHEAKGVSVAGNVAYLETSDVGLQILDVVNPTYPLLVGSYEPPHPKGVGVSVVGDVAYVVDVTYGLEILHVSNPAAPELLGSYATTANSVCVVGSKAYVTDGQLEIFDVSCPPCLPDLDRNGTLDLFDFLAFVNLFNAGDPKADCDHNASFDLFDFLCFVNAFNAGC